MADKAFGRSAVAGAVLALALAAGLPGGAAAQTPAAGTDDFARCQRLADYYDRYMPRTGNSLQESSGRLNRDVGYEQCRKGHVADGIRQIERAIRSGGFTPPA